MPKEPRREYQEGRIIAALTKEPLTAQALANKLHMTRDGINIHLKRMKESSPRLIYVSEYSYCRRGGRPAPIYSVGDLEDAVYVATREIKQGRLESIDRNMKEVIRLLRETPMTTLDLANAMGLSASWTRTYIANLRKEESKKIYVKDWQPRPGTHPAPVYAVGKKADKPLKAKTKLQFYHETKNDPDRNLRSKQRRELREVINNARKKPNGIFGALGI